MIGKIIFFSLIAVLAGSCNKTAPKGIYDNGKIEYKITYLESGSLKIAPSMLPKKMKLEFNQDYSTNLIEGFMGIFRLNNITNFKRKQCSTYLEVLNKNYIFNGKRGDEMCCFDAMEGMKIKFTDEKKIIAGLNCTKAIVKLEDNSEFDVYYTNDINLSNPNLTNPYQKIDGVLLEFHLYLSGLKMKFTAEKFESCDKIDIRNITIPQSTVEVSRDQMTQIMQKLME